MKETTSPIENWLLGNTLGETWTVRGEALFASLFQAGFTYDQWLELEHSDYVTVNRGAFDGNFVISSKGNARG